MQTEYTQNIPKPAICVVGPESSLDAFWIDKDVKFPHVGNEDAELFESSLGAHVRRYVFSRSQKSTIS